MYKVLSVWALVVLCAGLVHSWDYAMATEKRIDFFKNDTVTHSIASLQFKNLTALAYDALHDTLLIVDQQTDNSSVYRLNFTSNDIALILTRKQIQTIAYDPVKDLLFWVQEINIFSIPLKSGSKCDVSEQNLVIKLPDQIPSSIAVDSCEGFVYWTNKNIAKPTIERVRFDGSAREVVIDKDIHEPNHLVIDPQIKKMFWIDTRRNETHNYKLNHAYLNGTNESDSALGNGRIPTALSISNQFVYWADHGVKLFIYTLPKPYLHGLHESETGGQQSSKIVAKYTLAEQTKGIHECPTLTSLLQENATNNDNICVHGEKANATSCTCAPGYIGERCETSVCQNYCIQGTCSVSDEGEPSCRCESGYSGARCDFNMCSNYCLNNGVCYFTEENEPLCQCSGNYSGSRCEAIKTNTVCSTLSSGYINITNPKPAHNNFTIAEVLLNRRNVTKVTVNVEIESS
ncbi:protein cueball-like [Helicoverpa armigera]|uniref:protein cueball-like n=1 Tax=Helicoverpa armigera TaxID=29058 RepID=UPI00308280D5